MSIAAPAATPSVAQPAASPLALGVAIMLGIAALLMLAASDMLSDPDTQWHIATGAWIIEHRAVPEVDPFSHTFAGQPWIAKEWLAQVMLSLAYSAGGWRGVTLLTALATGAGLGLVGWFMARRCRDTLAIGAAAIGFMILAPTILARPHMLVLPLMAAWVIGLVSAVEKGRTPHPALLLVMVAWANMHAGFTIGLFVGGLLALEAIRDAGRAGWFGAGMRWGIFLAAALAATCISPYGVGALLVNLQMTGGVESLAYINEWRPLDLDGPGLAWVALAATLLIALATQPWRNLFRILAVALVTWLMIKHGRFVLLFPVFVFPLVAGPLTRISSAFAQSTGPVPNGRLPAVVMGGVAFLVAVLITTPRPQPNPLVTPVAALAAARAAGLEGPAYNSYDFGGFLIRNGVPTFIDGRTDQLFLGGFMRAQEEALRQAEPDALLSVIAPFRVTWAIVVTRGPERRLLERAGWTVRHADDVATLLVHPGGAALPLRGSLN